MEICTEFALISLFLASSWTRFGRISNVLIHSTLSVF